MAKKNLRKEIRSERIGTCFTPSEIEKIDYYCKKLGISRSEFVSTATCITLESGTAMKLAAHVLVPTIRGIRSAINDLRIDEPEFELK